MKNHSNSLKNKTIFDSLFELHLSIKVLLSCIIFLLITSNYLFQIIRIIRNEYISYAVIFLISTAISNMLFHLVLHKLFNSKDTATAPKIAEQQEESTKQQKELHIENIQITNEISRLSNTNLEALYKIAATGDHGLKYNPNEYLEYAATLDMLENKNIISIQNNSSDSEITAKLNEDCKKIVSHFFTTLIRNKLNSKMNFQIIYEFFSYMKGERNYPDFEDYEIKEILNSYVSIENIPNRGSYKQRLFKCDNQGGTVIVQLAPEIGNFTKHIEDVPSVDKEVTIPFSQHETS